MTVTTTTPAPVADLLDLFAVTVPAKPLHMRAALLQSARSQSWIFRDDGRAIAGVMLYPLPAEREGERLVELAFVCLPEIRAHLVPLIHHAHSTRAALAQSGLVRVRAHVRADHAPGKRLARLCGMELVGRFGGFERFEFEGGPDGGTCDPSVVVGGPIGRRGLRG